MASNKGQYLNQENIIKKVFDETTDALRVSTSGGMATSTEQQNQSAKLASIDNTLIQKLSGSLVPTAYDDIELVYTLDLLTSVIYRKAGILVKTLTLTYTGTNLTRVVAS